VLLLGCNWSIQILKHNTNWKNSHI